MEPVLTTTQSLVSKDPNSADLGALTSNSTFSRAADAQLALLDDAAQKAQIAAEKAADLAAASADIRSAIGLFASAMNSLRAIGARFPETAIYTNEAIKQTQYAMGAANGNAFVPPVKAAPAPAK